MSQHHGHVLLLSGKLMLFLSCIASAIARPHVIGAQVPESPQDIV